jgi:hypothetical protein
MSELWMHIGSHKTGTTSIQLACRNALRTRGAGAAHYLDVRKPETRIVRTSGKGKGFRCTIDMEAADAILRPTAGGPHAQRFVTSEEVLFWVSEPGMVADLARLLRARFERVRIIVYLRRQDELALSHRKQVILRLPAARFYGISTGPLPRYAPHFDTYFDYASKLSDIWSAAFGKRNVHVVPYRRDALVGGDVVSDFAHRTKTAFAGNTPRAANRSLAGNQTFLGLRLAKTGVPAARCQDILDRLAPRGAYLPAREEARTFVRHFEASNRRLAREWLWNDAPFTFGTEFDGYPEEQTRFSDQDLTEMLDAVLPFTRDPPGRADKG